MSRKFIPVDEAAKSGSRTRPLLRPMTRLRKSLLWPRRWSRRAAQPT